MKISVITPTYNRAILLERLYKSILQNNNDDIIIEWLIIDDGSNDNTKEMVDKFISDNQIEIMYNFQNNQGKMIAINNTIPNATRRFNNRM